MHTITIPSSSTMFSALERRNAILGIKPVFSRDEKMVRGIMTMQSRSKYRPHYGAKEAAKYAARGKL